MTYNIIELREQIVGLSKDPIETRKLLDQLAEEEIFNANVHSPFHVGEKDIVETKDGDYYKLHKTKDGYVLHYFGGYAVKVDDKLLSTASALDMIMHGIPDEMLNGLTDEQKENMKISMPNAIEMVFRLPMFILSHPETTFNVATMGVQYLLLLQRMGEVPTPETDNHEYDKYIAQMNELMENFATGLEKEGLEYEKRMGYAEENTKCQNQDQGESKAEA